MHGEDDHLLTATHMSDLYQHWRSSLDAALAPLEPKLTRCQWQVMGKFVCKGGKMTQQHLGELLAMDSGQLTRVLRQLEELGMLHKSIDQQDRRIRYLELSNPKASYVKQLIACNKKVNQRICSALNQEEQQQFLSLLKKLNHKT